MNSNIQLIKYKFIKKNIYYIYIIKIYSENINNHTIVVSFYDDSDNLICCRDTDSKCL